MATKILIADDHAIVRQGLIQILSDYPDMVVEGEAEDGSEVLKLIKEKDFDVIVLDLNMPAGGLDILKQLKLLKPGIPVLVLSYYPEEQYATRVLKAGASGYINKLSATDEMIAAIHKISKGGTYLSPRLMDKLAHDIIDKGEKPVHETLSDREYQVMLLIGSGKTPTEIADKLSLSVKTVSTYRSRILSKMKLKNSSQIMNYVVKNDLIE